MKILIALLVLILFGTLVGSNLAPEITVIILSQPTISLPIGGWLAIAIGLGLLSSMVIQLAIFVDRRWLQQQIRQSQTRSSQPDRDTFTYTSSVPEADSSSPQKTVRQTSASDRQPSPPSAQTPNPKKSLFNSYRSQSVAAAATPKEQRSTSKSPTKSGENDLDDWEIEPVSNRQLEWDDSISSRQQDRQSSPRSSESESSFPPQRSTQKSYSSSEQTRREVYDADFRLIQPPYKGRVETEFDDDRGVDNFEYTEIDEADDLDRPSAAKSSATKRSTASKNSDIEDWGFDFEDVDPPTRAK